MTSEVLNEVSEKLRTITGIDTAVIIKSSKFIRYDWRSLLEQYQKGQSTFKTPYILLKPNATRDRDDSMSCLSQDFFIEAGIVLSEEDSINTTVALAANSAIQKVGSTSGMFAGQNLVFKDAGLIRKIQSVNSSTEITLTSSVTSTLNEVVRSDITDDLEVLCDKIQTTFEQGTAWDNFLIMEDPERDVTENNEINIYAEANNYPVMAGLVTIKTVIGYIY